MLWQKGESTVTIRELCEKEVIQLEQGVCLGRADDLELDPATAQLQRPGREPDDPLAGDRDHWHGRYSGAYRRAKSTGSTARLLAAAARKAGSVKNRGIF